MLAEMVRRVLFPSACVCAALVALVACSSGSSDKSPATAGTSGGTKTAPRETDLLTIADETLDVDGTTRSFTLAVPKARASGKGLPLVLELHGDGGDGPGMREAYPIDALSGARAIVAYPSGIDAGWQLYEPTATNQDMKFIDALVAKLVADRGADPKRVFGVGFSSGGYMLNQIACRKNGFFRGIVAHAAGAPQEPQDPEAGEWQSDFVRCNGQEMAPTGGVATLSVMGQYDDVEGGRFVATYWALVNGCGTSTAPATAPCEAYAGCPADKPVQLCLVPGLGHAIWDKGMERSWSFIAALL
jgi:polyhydroxybutyrate depolymerase